MSLDILLSPESPLFDLDGLDSGFEWLLFTVGMLQANLPKALTKPDRGPRPFSISKVVAIIREMGWSSAVVGTFLFALRLVRSWWWDWSHNVTTRHRVPLSKLNLTGPSAASAQFYEPSDIKCLPRLLRRLGIPYGNYAFVDVGVGQGRTMFLAAAHPFKRIVGVELSPSLSSIALQNCGTFKSNNQLCKNFEVYCADAAEFAFPNEPLVIYMFNPFGESVLSLMLTNLMQSLQRQPREVFLIYYHPSHSQVIQRAGAFELLLQGIDEWDYRKLGYHVYRARTQAAS